jgi:hypothetical protein
MDKSQWEGFQALACSIEESARLDPNPNIGRLYPKSHRHLMRYTKEKKNNDE